MAVQQCWMFIGYTIELYTGWFLQSLCMVSFILLVHLTQEAVLEGKGCSHQRKAQPLVEEVCEVQSNKSNFRSLIR